VEQVFQSDAKDGIDRGLGVVVKNSASLLCRSLTDRSTRIV